MFATVVYWESQENLLNSFQILTNLVQNVADPGLDLFKRVHNSLNKIRKLNKFKSVTIFSSPPNKR